MEEVVFNTCLTRSPFAMASVAPAVAPTWWLKSGFFLGLCVECGKPQMCVTAEVCCVGTKALSVPPPSSSQLVSGVIYMSLLAKLMLDHSFNGRPVGDLSTHAGPFLPKQGQHALLSLVAIGLLSLSNLKYVHSADILSTGLPRKEMIRKEKKGSYSRQPRGAALCSPG